MSELDPEFQAEIDAAAARIVEASYSAAIAAVSRAFGRDVPVVREQNRRGRPARARRRESGAARRSSAEVDALAERLYEAILDEPGQAMSVLAARVGSEPRALLPAVARLKNARRIRTTGQRQATRYFPLSSFGRR